MGHNSSKHTTEIIEEKQNIDIKKIYYNVQTGKPHIFTKGENVLLKGNALEFSKIKEYLPLTTITGIDDEQNIVALQFYKETDSFARKDCIGNSSEIKSFLICNAIQPLPIYTTTIDYEALGFLALTSKEENICDYAIYHDQSLNEQLNILKHNVLSHLTKNTCQQKIRFTLFTCSRENIKNGLFYRPIIIATIRKENGTNRYCILNCPPTITFQVALLNTIHLPITQAYINAIPWSIIPQYKELAANLESFNIECIDVDNIWLLNQITILLLKGYEWTLIHLPNSF